MDAVGSAKRCGAALRAAHRTRRCVSIRARQRTRKGRLLYLPTEVRAVLEAQWQEHLAAYPDWRLAFHRDGERIFSFYKAWDKACRLAGVIWKVPRDFRRSAVRNMVRTGIPKRVAMEIAGTRRWRSPTDTTSAATAIYNNYPRH